MRIALCSDQYLPLLSGLADSVDTLALSLRAQGHEVRIYTVRFPEAKADLDVWYFPAYIDPKGGGATVIAFPRGGIRDMRAFKPDIIHVHTAGVVGFFALYAAWRLKVPLVGTHHTSPADYLHYAGLDFWPFPFLIRRFTSWFYGHCRAVTGPSQHILDELYEYGMRTTPSRVISNPVSLEKFRPLGNKEELQKKFGLESRTILLFGRIALEKNLDFAIEIVAEVCRRTRAQLVILGGGPYEMALREKIKKEGIEERVRFLGVLRGEALVEALAATDVYLVTSLSETQSMTMIQAMAVGLPVVAASAGGLREYVIDGYTGFLEGPKDKEGFVRKILQLLDDEPLRKDFGSAGRAAVARYRPQEIVQRFIEVYQNVLQ